MQLRKSVSSLQSQLEESTKKESETSKHFWNLTEDTKQLKGEMETAKRERDTLKEKYSELEVQHRSIAEMSSAKEQTLIAELEQVRSTIDQAIIQASNQKEIQMREEFKEMLERMGGLQEAVEMHKDEIQSVEEDRNVYIHKLNKQKDETERVNDMLRQERKKSDQAALEIATLSQNLNSLNSTNKNANSAIEKSQEEITGLQEEVGKLRAELQIAKNQREEDSQLVAVAMSERDGIMNRYRSDAEQHRMTVESLRKSEQNAAQQVQQLVSQLENMKGQQEIMQNQIQQGSAATNAELENYKNVCDQLQKELEVRLEQLSQETERADENAREASAIRNEVKSKAEEMQEREKSWARSYTKEKERLQSQFATIQLRCSNLEQEKGDLLKEGESMQAELKEYRKEKEDALDKVRNLEKDLGEKERDMAKVKGEKIELLEELKAVNRREEETQANTAKREQGLLQELDDVKHQLKNTKKLSAGQVMEFQVQTEELMKQMMKKEGLLAGTKSNLDERNLLFDELEVQNAELKGRLEEVQASFLNEISEKKRDIERFKVRRSEERNGARSEATRISHTCIFV